MIPLPSGAVALVILFLLGGLTAAEQVEVRSLPPLSRGKPGFALRSAESAGIRFTNTLSLEAAAANRVLELGSGVAAGDIDNDGLADLFFCSLAGDCRLYRNRGDLIFEDVTRASGLNLQGLTCRGAAFVDIDGDTLADLLVSVMGRGVLCFRNTGHGHFEDWTGPAGTANPFGAMSMAFADVDGNGTVDLYVTNYRTNDVRDVGRVDLRSVDGRLVVPPGLQSRFLLVDGKVQEYGEPDLLYLNDGSGRFKPASWIKGQFRDSQGKPLTHAPLDWGLTAAFHDLNGDGAPDLYVCNDFWTPDRIWINDGHGSFRALDPRSLRHMSASSMGIDFADLDGDGFEDFFVVDMLARTRSERLTQAPSYSGPESPVGGIDNCPQINRNTLFHNRGDGSWEEIAELSGVEGTDWSWQPLFVDVDLDGRPDLLVASGNSRSVQEMDANESVDRIHRRFPVHERIVEYEGERMPFEKAFTLQRIRELRLYSPYPSPLYAFQNDGRLHFEDKTRDWELSRKAIRQGIALVDLDNDGDLDLVVNPLNSEPELWVNQSSAPRVSVELKGRAPNTDAIGAKVVLYGGPVPRQSAEVAAGGHYLSSSQRKLVFAAGKQMRLEVTWRDGSQRVVPNIEANHTYVIWQ